MLSPQGRRRRGADFHAAVHAARDVHTEERILEVGDGINVCAHARGAGLGEEVASAERQNAVALRESVLEGDAVCVQPRGVHDVSCPDRSRGRDCPPRPARPVRRSGQDCDPCRARIAHQGRDDLRRIDGRGAGGEQRAVDSFGPGFDAPSFLRREDFQRHSSRASPAQQLLQAGEVGRARSDNQLAAAAEPQAALTAVGGESLVALEGEPRLERVGGVVEAGMQHAAVAAARVETATGLLLEQGDGTVAVAAFELEGQGEAHDAPAHDQEVRGGCCGHERGTGGPGGRAT